MLLWVIDMLFEMEVQDMVMVKFGDDDECHIPRYRGFLWTIFV